MIQEVGADGMLGIYTVAAPEAVAFLPTWVWNIITSLWSAVVAVFYMPHYQCTELGYFEIAKSTSGIGEGVSPRQDQGPWGNGPDNLGGY